MSGHRTPAISADTIAESVKAVIADLGDLPGAVARMTATDAEASARIAGRLSEELAEVAAMLRSYATSVGPERSAR